MHYMSNVADYAEPLFNGTGFTLTFTRHPTFSSTDHTVRLVHAGSGGRYIDVDEIEVLP